jgi:hypothetical protein
VAKAAAPRVRFLQFSRFCPLLMKDLQRRFYRVATPIADPSARELNCRKSAAGSLLSRSEDWAGSGAPTPGWLNSTP